MHTRAGTVTLVIRTGIIVRGAGRTRSLIGSKAVSRSRTRVTALIVLANTCSVAVSVLSTGYVLTYPAGANPG